MQKQALLQQQQTLQRRPHQRWAPRSRGDGRPPPLCRAFPNYYVFASDERTFTTSTTSSSLKGLLSPEVAAETSTVQVFVRSNWRSALLHGSAQGGEWRDYPLTQVCVCQCCVVCVRERG